MGNIVAELSDESPWLVIDRGDNWPGADMGDEMSYDMHMRLAGLYVQSHFSRLLHFPLSLSSFIC